MPPPLMLEILKWWIEEGMIDEIINWHRREIMARLKIAKAVLGSGRLCCESGKYHVWLRHPHGWHSSDFVERSYEYGVSLRPCDTFTVNANQEAPDAASISLGFPKIG